jgi:O-antigen biosynthesis protein
MEATSDLLKNPILFLEPERLSRIPSWHEHIPFAMFATSVLRPRVFVELGTLYGDSYCAFCQSVNYLNLPTHCYAVDTWLGDEHASFQFVDALSDLQAHHDPRYAGFSSLIQSTFDDALPRFPNGGIDLLHIDGCHTYEAVRHDFETWLPKLSAGGVVLFHDTQVFDRGFGVHRYWDEIKVNFPHFEFLHGHGLGVLAVSPSHDSALSSWFQADEAVVGAIRGLFSSLGNRLALRKQNQLLSADLEKLREAKSAAEQDFQSQLSMIHTSNAWKLVERFWRLRSSWGVRGGR